MLNNEDLYVLYEQYNELYFHKQLPPAEDVTLAFSGRLTAAAGICYPHKKIIRLSTHYHRRFPEEITATLLHEMIHLLVRQHGTEFKRWMEHIRQQGGHVEIHARERATAAAYLWYYTCKECGQGYPRKKRLLKQGKFHRCGQCGGSLIETKSG